MTNPRLGLAGAIFSVLASMAWADPPQVGGTVPFGVQRGVATDLAIQGANLAGQPQLVAPFPIAVEPATAPNADAGTWKLKVTAGPGTPVGVYPIRVKSDDGISNPWLFAVGQVPQVAEVEDNSTFEAAQVVPSPVVVEGQVAGNDVDFFKFAGKAGQRVVVDAQCARIGSGVDPTIRLTTARRGFVASAEDSPGLATDARLTAVLPADGDYVVELSDTRYQGGGRPVYRLLIGPVPVADEVFPLGGRRGELVSLEFRGGTLPDTLRADVLLDAPAGSEVFRPQVAGPPVDNVRLGLELIAPLQVGGLPEAREPIEPNASPLRMAAPATLNGRIDPVGDEDRFLVGVTPGKAYRARVLASSDGSALDGQLQVLGVNGGVLGLGDDQNFPPAAPGLTALVSPDPVVDFTPPAGTTEVTLVLRDLEGRGGMGFPYRIVVDEIRPTFEVRLNDAQISVPKGGTAAVGVTVSRQGYNGPIALAVANLPPGLTVRPGTIPAGQGVGALTVSAAGDASFGAVELQVIGEGAGPEGPIVRAASRTVVFAQQGTVPTNLVTFAGLPAAIALPGAMVLDAPAAIEVVHGYGAAIPIKVARTPGADGAFAITVLPLTGGLSVPTITIPEKAAEGPVPVNAALEASLGKTTVALIARGKFAGKEQAFAVPLVTVEIIRPAALELAAPGIELKPGETAEIKGKVIRRGPFKEPVTLRIDGLPPGLKADPATLAPDANEFILKVSADGGAPPASTTATVAMAFQVNKKDYVSPPAPLSIKVSPK